MRKMHWQTQFGEKKRMWPYQNRYGVYAVILNAEENKLFSCSHLMALGSCQVDAKLKQVKIIKKP